MDANADTALRSELFEALVQGVEEYAIFMLWPDGRIATWNSGAERIQGWRADEIIGRHFSGLFPQEDVCDGKPERELAAAAAQGSHAEESWRVRKDGSRFYASVVITALPGCDGALRGFAKVTRDLTEPLRAADARRSLAEARDAVRARDDFLAIASHELRTPLTGLRLLVQSALRPPGDSGFQIDRLVDRLRGIDRYLLRMERLVNGLLELTTLTSGRLRLSPSALDLAALVRDEVTARTRELPAGNGAVVLVAGEALPGHWDRARIRQAVGAVIDNALKYGGAAPVRVSVGREGQWAVVAVEDRGLGIAPEDQARVFERFERAVPASHYGGFGVGLWAARQIVTAHGGEIEVQSSPGQGSRFTIRVPLAPA